ncbi:MAG TPA: L,D-transpeptidase family protein [Terrimicrobiaceae bacterium]
MKIRLVVTILFLLTGFAVWLYRHFFRSLSLPPKPRTIEQVLVAIGPSVEGRLRPAFDRVGATWPPRDLILLAFKAERRLELYASHANEKPRFVCSYPILGASGSLGPKLREGDKQVPEGFYRIELLNPNSRYHLSLRVNYPNADDVEHAREEGRDLSTLGGDIMIHGGSASIGCLAVGDTAAEELFFLAARAGLDNIRLIIAPRDFRKSNRAAALEDAPVWTVELHKRIRTKLAEFPF